MRPPMGELYFRLMREGEVVVTLGLVAYRVTTTEYPPFVRASWFWPHHDAAELHPVEWADPGHASVSPGRNAEALLTAILDGSVTRVKVPA